MPNKSQFAQTMLDTPRRFHRRLVEATRSRYESCLRHGLGDGFIKPDYLSMVSASKPFLLPRLDSVALRRRRLELHGLRLLLQGLAPRMSGQCLKESVDRVVALPPKSWNPARQVSSIVERPLVPYRDAQTEVVLYLIPASRQIDWASPRGVMAAIQNYLIPGAKHYIGHAAIELRERGRTVALTAMTGETNLRVMKELLFDGLGLSFLSGTFPGRLMGAREVHDDLTEHFRERRIAYLRVPTTNARLYEALAFLDQWAEMGAYRRYGLWAEADFQTGAGCSAFAIEVLRRIEPRASQLFDSCLRDIRLPSEWLGSRDGGRRVSLLELMKLTFGSHAPTRWAKPHEPHRLIRFWDPDLMVQALETLTPQSTGVDVSAERFQRGRGVTLQTDPDDLQMCA